MKAALRFIPAALAAPLRHAVAVALLGSCALANAHVDYINLSDPFFGGIGDGAFSNNGWYAGTTPQLGDSHDLAQGTFFSFHLEQASRVSITFSETSATPGGLNPAFSLYKGLLPVEAHDDTTFDPLNPRSSTFPFPKIASPVDNGALSPFRDTANATFNGQFDALHSWSMANEGGEWGVIQYVTHVGPAGGNTVSLVGYVLAAGDYTIAAGGGMAFLPGNPGITTNLDGQVSLTVTPVPEPEIAGLMLAGLATIGWVRRKKASAVRNTR